MTSFKFGTYPLHPTPTSSTAWSRSASPQRQASEASILNIQADQLDFEPKSPKGTSHLRQVEQVPATPTHKAEACHTEGNSQNLKLSESILDLLMPQDQSFWEPDQPFSDFDLFRAPSPEFHEHINALQASEPNPFAASPFETTPAGSQWQNTTDKHKPGMSRFSSFPSFLSLAREKSNPFELPPLTQQEQDQLSFKQPAQQTKSKKRKNGGTIKRDTTHRTRDLNGKFSKPEKAQETHPTSSLAKLGFQPLLPTHDTLDDIPENSMSPLQPTLSKPASRAPKSSQKIELVKKASSQVQATRRTQAADHTQSTRQSRALNRAQAIKRAQATSRTQAISQAQAIRRARKLASLFITRTRDANGKFAPKN